MMGIYALIRSIILAGFVLQIQGRVKVSFELSDFENTGHKKLDGDCCDFLCGSCDNRFNLCFDAYSGNNDMTDCAYGNFQTDRLYDNNDDFSFPSTLADDLVNPIVLTINSWSTGIRSKIEVWDHDSFNADDKIDYYGYNYNYIPNRTSALATEHIVSLHGAGTSLTRVAVKIYCDLHYYGTSSGCSTYCLARDNSEGHYNCDGITGARVCHSGWQGSYCNIEINECDSDPCQFNAVCTDLLADYSCNCPAGTRGKNCDDIDECSSDPCEHGGTCENKLNLYQCDCPREYSGANCDFEIEFCNSNPCLNGATCLGENDIGVLECVCAPGYTGGFCGADIDECIGVDCLNNGTCQDGVNEFTCNCTEGYGGTNCELPHQTGTGQIHGRVKVSFRLVDFENTGHIELDGGCCDSSIFGCGSSCDNRFNLCFDVYRGNNDMTDCAHGNFQTNHIYDNNDDFSFPSILASNLVNPIVLTINSWSTGFRSKIEVWDFDPYNADDKIDYYGYDYNYIPDQTSALATEHNVTLNGAGTSLTTVAVKVYCDEHYYGTSSGCSTYCLARDSSEGHYDCNDITGARVCHSGWQGSYCNLASHDLNK